MGGYRYPDTMVTVEDVKDWEKRYGRLPYMYSGWDAKVNDPKAFVNLDDSNTMHTPGFASETAEFLIRERQVVDIGVDTLSIDTGMSNEFPVHKAWLAAGWQVGYRVCGKPWSSVTFRRHRLRRRN